MSRLEEKNIKILNERYPYHNLSDDKDLELQQFTAEDMVDFALYVAKTSLEKASENAEIIESPDSDYCDYIDKESITNESNIVLL